MEAIVLSAPRIDALRSTTYPDPVTGPGDVSVRLRAASLNFLDIAVATGEYPLKSFPIIPVTDGAGEIADVGTAVTDWKIGERVTPHFIPGWQDGTIPSVSGGPRRGIDLPGSLAEYVVVPHTRWFVHQRISRMLKLPPYRSLGLHKTTLLLGTGGVSLFALQFDKAHGSRVIVTSSSDEKLQSAPALGADQVINYQSTPLWADEVLRLTKGRGADLVLETGGTATFPQSIKATALDGTVFIIGFLSGMDVSFSLGSVMEKRLRLQGNNTGPVADLADAAAAITASGIRPVLDATFPMGQAQAAYKHVAE